MFLFFPPWGTDVKFCFHKIKKIRGKKKNLKNALTLCVFWQKGPCGLSDPQNTKVKPKICARLKKECNYSLAPDLKCSLLIIASYRFVCQYYRFSASSL